MQTFEPSDGYHKAIMKFDEADYTEFCNKYKNIITSTSVLIHGIDRYGKRYFRDGVLEDYFRYNGKDKVKPFAILEKLRDEFLCFPED